jgi:S1-C subfamily serine protease
VNDDGQVNRCAATSWGWGLAGAAAAAGARKANVECAEDLRRLGFVPLPPVKTGLLMKGHPLRVERIEPGLPAETAGIQVGDTVLEADGHPIAKFTDFASVLSTKQPGETMMIRIERNGERRMLTVGVVAR